MCIRDRCTIYYTGWYKMKFKGDAVYNNSVAGIVTSMKTNYVVRIAGKEVCDCPFTLFDSLCADNCSDIRWAQIQK